MTLSIRLCSPLLAAAGLLAALPASARLNVIYALDFDDPATPWASSGVVGGTNSVGTPLLQNTDLAPGAGNAYSARFDGSQFQYGSLFESLDPALVGYGVQIWVKNPGSTYQESDLWQNIVSFGFPADSGDPDQENGVAVGIYGNEYYGVSNRAVGAGFPAVRGTIPPGGGGSINGWDHIAFVAESIGGSFYLNGVLQGSRTLPGLTPPTGAWHFFTGSGGFPSYTGLADNLKLFTFNIGTFDPGQLDYAIATAIPEPSTFVALAGLGALGFVATRRRRA